MRDVAGCDASRRLVDGGGISVRAEILLGDGVVRTVRYALDRHTLTVLEGEGRRAVGAGGDAVQRSLAGEGSSQRLIVIVRQGQREAEGLEAVGEVAAYRFADRQIIQQGRIGVGNGRGEAVGRARIGVADDEAPPAYDDAVVGSGNADLDEAVGIGSTSRCYHKG